MFAVVTDGNITSFPKGNKGIKIGILITCERTFYKVFHQDFFYFKVTFFKNIT